MHFENIPINTTDIAQSELNVICRKRTNLFAWNGQFSPQFVESVLRCYCCKPGQIVLDMFAGSGTVLIECARLGIEAYGNELNASAYFIAKLYELCNIRIEERLSTLNAVDNILFKVLINNGTLKDIIQAENENKTTRVGDVIRALIVLLDIYNKDCTSERIVKISNNIRRAISSFPMTTAPIRISQGDARILPLFDSSVDVVFTSPPYINVFNYHQKYRLSVESLDVDVLKLARSEFGANRKHRGNRLYTVIQYCIDIALSIKEANRVCKTGARLIYVVGRCSTVLGYSFCNSELIYTIATEIFCFKLLLRQERSFKNRYGETIFEDILHFENGEKCIESDDFVSNAAREIAIRILTDKLAVDNKNNNLLLEAIHNAKKIQTSEYYVN